MPRDGFPCACYSEWYGSGKCAHHAERDTLELEHHEIGPRELHFESHASYMAAYRSWQAELLAA